MSQNNGVIWIETVERWMTYEKNMHRGYVIDWFSVGCYFAENVCIHLVYNYLNIV